MFSFERHESLEGAVATEAFTHSTANVHRFVVLAAVDGVDVALEVTSDRAIDLEPLVDERGRRPVLRQAVTRRGTGPGPTGR